MLVGCATAQKREEPRDILKTNFSSSQYERQNISFRIKFACIIPYFIKSSMVRFPVDFAYHSRHTHKTPQLANINYTECAKYSRVLLGGVHAIYTHVLCTSEQFGSKALSLTLTPTPNIKNTISFSPPDAIMQNKCALSFLPDPDACTH